MEVGTEPDFLLIMKNNLQDPNVANPSKMAGKYMAFGKGNLSDLFFSSGIKFEANKMYKFANNFNYDEESSETVEPQAEAEIQESTNDEIARESDNRPKAAQDHSKKARTLPKTGCYAVPPISQPGSPLEKQIIPSLFTQGRYLNQVFCDFLTKTTTMTTNLKRRNQQTKIPTSNSRSAIERVNLMECPQIC